MNEPNLKIEWKDVIKYSIEIARGIYYLHSWRPPIVHRDIKSSNMLLDRYGTIKV
jgi:serine/threonine protein kinase